MSLTTSISTVTHAISILICSRKQRPIGSGKWCPQEAPYEILLHEQRFIGSRARVPRNLPQEFQEAQRLVRPSGHISNDLGEVAEDTKVHIFSSLTSLSKNNQFWPFAGYSGSLFLCESACWHRVFYTYSLPIPSRKHFPRQVEFLKIQPQYFTS